MSAGKDETTRELRNVVLAGDKTEIDPALSSLGLRTSG